MEEKMSTVGLSRISTNRATERDHRTAGASGMESFETRQEDGQVVRINSVEIPLSVETEVPVSLGSPRVFNICYHR